MEPSMNYDFSHWDILPKVSCQCLTYGRPHLLSEAVQSFILQDYPGPKELVILNDHPTIKVVPHVSIKGNKSIKWINLEERLPTIGEKRNYCCDKCSGDIIMCWDDDDISLPWRMSVTIQYMTNHMHFKPVQFIKYKRNRIIGVQSTTIGHNMSGMSKKLWEEIGGYKEMQSGQDQVIEKAINKSGFQSSERVTLSEIFYIYRWIGTGSYHLSHKGWGKGFEYCEKMVAKSQYKAGEYIIVPSWSVDFTDLYKLYLNSPKRNPVKRITRKRI